MKHQSHFQGARFLVICVMKKLLFYVEKITFVNSRSREKLSWDQEKKKVKNNAWPSRLQYMYTSIIIVLFTASQTLFFYQCVL